MNKRIAYISFITLLRHEIVRILRIWPQTMLPPVVTTALYYVIFGNVIGGKLGAMDGVPYIQYIMPGLVLMNIIDSSYINTVSSFFASKYFKSIEEMLITPMSEHSILCGYLGGSMARGLFVGLLVAFVSMFFTKIKVYSWLLTIFLAVITSTFLSLVGFINGVFARKFDDLSIVPTFILAPLSFFGGVFYSVDLLPDFWRSATYANPIFYMISGFRYAMLGTSDVNIGIALCMLGVGIILLYFLCLKLLKAGIGIKS